MCEQVSFIYCIFMGVQRWLNAFFGVYSRDSHYFVNLSLLFLSYGCIDFGMGYCILCQEFIGQLSSSTFLM